MLASLADRISARPRRALLALLAFVVLAAGLGAPVAGVLEDSGGFTATDSDSEQAYRRINEATGRQSSPALVVLVSSREGATAPATQRRLLAARAELERRPGIASVSPVATSPESPAVSRDGRSTYLAVTLDADADEEAILTGVQERVAEEPGFALGGPLVADQQVGDAVVRDLGRAEVLAFPLLLALSLLFFRGVRAASLPLIVGITTVLGTFLALRVVNEAYGLSIFALNLVIGLGLGLAIDYSLFLVTRFREELERQGPGAAAIRTTMRTAGRTVAFSAATVAIALVTLTVFPLGFLRSMGIAGAVVATVAGLASLTVSPALFAVWGPKLAVRRRGARGARRGTPAAPAPGRWYRLSHAVMRRPVLVATATSLVMLAAAAPALRANWTPVDSSVIPKGESSRTVADALQRDFRAQGTDPVSVVLSAPRGDRAGVLSYADGLRSLPGVRAVQPPRSLDERTWQVDMAVAGDPQGPAAQDLVSTVRDLDGPYPALVTGGAAEFVDQQGAIGSRLGLAVALLAGLTFLVLWLMTGSVVLPAKAILMNALTVGASLGVLTLVYQDGRFEDLLGYTGNGGIEPTDFLVAAALVFALSTDYGVFLLGRIKEARDGGSPEREAVAVGLERTGAVVTAAAILLAVAIGAFSTSSISFIQQIGVAAAAGVLLDAFVVRALLVPSLMALLGRRNWWSPRPLRRLHEKVGLRERSGAVAAEV